MSVHVAAAGGASQNGFPALSGSHRQAPARTQQQSSAEPEPAAQSSERDRVSEGLRAANKVRIGCHGTRNHLGTGHVVWGTRTSMSVHGTLQAVDRHVCFSIQTC